MRARSIPFWICMLVGLSFGCGASHPADATDADVHACDAPPIAYCRAAVPSGGEGCCGDYVAPLCRSGGGYACPTGSHELGACTGCIADAACVSPTDCVLTPATCCGTCGVPTPGDVIAVRTDQLAATRAAACGPGPVACPACAGRIDPYFLATCAAGNCAARDLRMDALTTCSVDADCTLAASTCCACGAIGMDAAIAFNPANGTLAELICDPRADCPPCVPTFTGLAARCTDGRCTVVATP